METTSSVNSRSSAGYRYYSVCVSSWRIPGQPRDHYFKTPLAVLPKICSANPRYIFFVSCAKLFTWILLFLGWTIECIVTACCNTLCFTKSPARFKIWRADVGLTPHTLIRAASIASGRQCRKPFSFVAERYPDISPRVKFARCRENASVILELRTNRRNSVVRRFITLCFSYKKNPAIYAKFAAFYRPRSILPNNSTTKHQRQIWRTVI